MAKRKTLGVPNVPESERRSFFECMESIRSQEMAMDRLQTLQYALTFNRQFSRYCAWSDADVAEMLTVIDLHLPISKRLKHPGQRRKSAQRTPTITELAPVSAETLDVFSRSLPYRPYVSNELDAGLKIVGRGTADLYRYIQHNQPSLHKWMVFDCDYADALATVERKKLPLPTYVAVNPKNGHSHLFYGLRDAVCTSELAHAKPLKLLQKIEYAMTEALEADTQYGGFISKNPLNHHWQVQDVNPELWGLLDFQEHIDLPRKIPKKASVLGVGRNCTLFEVVRRQAYQAVLSYRMTSGSGAFRDYIQALVISHNATFPVPLEFPEIRAIAKSISKWTWENYTGRWTDLKFSEKQARRGTLGGIAKGHANAEKRATAMQMASQNCSPAQIAKDLRVGLATIYRWLKTPS